MAVTDADNEVAIEHQCDLLRPPQKRTPLAERIAAYREAAVAEIVAWLREFGNHPHGGAENCPRCQIADAIERGDYKGQSDAA